MIHISIHNLSIHNKLYKYNPFCYNHRLSDNNNIDFFIDKLLSKDKIIGMIF